MADRRVGDWRNGVDFDAELHELRRNARRGRRVVAVGLVIAVGFLIAFALAGNSDGVGYMATVVFFLALFAGGLTLMGRRRS